MTTENEDLVIAPVTMGQTMSIAASIIGSSFSLFYTPSDSEENKIAISYLCIAVFLNQFCNAAKHKDKMIAILKIVLEEMEHDQTLP